MSTHNICFCGEARNILTFFAWNSALPRAIFTSALACTHAFLYREWWLVYSFSEISSRYIFALNIGTPWYLILLVLKFERMCYYLLCQKYEWEEKMFSVDMAQFLQQTADYKLRLAKFKKCTIFILNIDFTICQSSSSFRRHQQVVI